MRINNMKIRSQLVLFSLLGVGAALCIITVVCLSIFHQALMAQIKDAQDDHLRVFWELLKDKGTHFQIADGRIMADSYVLNDNNELPDKIKKLLGGAATIFMGDVRISTNIMKPEGGRATGTKLQGPAYETLFKEKKSYRGEADVLGAKYFTAYDPIKNDQGEIIGALFVGIKESDYFAPFYRLVILIIIIAVCILAGVGTLTYLVTRRLIAPLDHVVAAAGELAKGNLTTQVEVKAGNEIGELADSFNHMIKSVREMVAQINSTAGTLSVSSEQLRSTADDLYKGTQDLNSQTDQVVTAMTEVSQTNMDVAKNASSAADAAKNSSGTAVQGKSVIDATANSMEAISETVNGAATTIEELGKSSAQIGEIVAVINGIADQTNLLALNAAIEAARAGEQGRGFAVVADEVRKLAERTGQATQDIADRISAIQKAATESVEAMRKGAEEVTKGVDQAKEASMSLDSIVQVSSLSMDMVQRIAAATEQQSAASEQVTQNMTSISTITKQAAASTVSIKQSSDELAQQTAKLHEMTTWFKV